MPSHSSPLPATCARCYIYSKDSRSLYSVVRKLCFCWWRTGPSSHSNFWF